MKYTNLINKIYLLVSSKYFIPLSWELAWLIVKDPGTICYVLSKGNYFFKNICGNILSIKIQPFCLWDDTLTHCGLVIAYGDMEQGQHWFRQWLVAWWHRHDFIPFLHSVGIVHIHVSSHSTQWVNAMMTVLCRFIYIKYNLALMTCQQLPHTKS